MSGKHSVKKKRKTQQKDNRIIIISSMMIFVVLFVTIIAVLVESPEGPANENGSSGSETARAESTTAPVSDLEEELQTESISEATLFPGHGMEITKIGSYTGLYMEDGSDEVVSKVLMIMVENTGDEFIQYAEITLSGDNSTAKFTLSSLFPGERMVVLESSRQGYQSDVKYSEAVAGNVSVFKEAPSLCESRLKVQGLNGVLNVTNISGEDITGDIVIYYKNAIDEVLYGGITYRVRITGGLKDGEIKQIVSDHFSAVGSEIIFITCGE